MRKPGRAIVLAAVLAAQIVMLASASGARGASILWTLTASPLTATTGVQRVFTLTATNEDPLAAILSSSEIGCVIVDVPGNFTIAAATVTGSNAGETWHVDAIVGNRVKVHTDSGGDRLGLLGWVRFTVTATAFNSGSLTWNSRAFRQQDCTGGAAILGVPPIVLVTGPAVTPTPIPTPTPTPTPTPSPTPKPTSTPTPRPTPTPTPTPILPLPSVPLPSLPIPIPSLPLPEPSNEPPPPEPSGNGSSSPQPTTAPDGPVSVAPPGPGGSSAPSNTGPGGSSAPSSTDAGGAPQPGSVGPQAPGAVDIAPRIVFDEARLELGTGGLGVFADIFWTVPAATLGVPGILLIIWVGLQTVGALAWIPAVRRLRGDEPTTP